VFAETQSLLNRLILDDSIKLRQAEKMLVDQIDRAIVSTDFVKQWRIGVVNTIVASSYTKTVIKDTPLIYGERLYNTSLFPDKKKLSTRIRLNTGEMIRQQK